MKNNETLSVWDVFEEYADVRDDLEYLLDSYDILQEDIRIAMEDITDELDRLRQRLLRCDRIFKRYQTARSSFERE